MQNGGGASYIHKRVMDEISPKSTYHVWMKAVQIVIKPKAKVITAKKIRGPTIRTANVAGS